MASALVNGSQFEVSKFRLLGFGFGIVLVVNDDNDGAVRSDLDGLSPLLGCAGDVGKGEPGCRYKVTKRIAEVARQARSGRLGLAVTF